MISLPARERILQHLRQSAKATLRAFASVPFALFICFYAVYFNAGQKLRDTPVFDRGDVFFRADTRRAWRDIVGERTSAHVHTSGHPNFVIFSQPLGSALTTIVKKEYKCTKNDAAKTASMLITSALSAGTVAFLFLLLGVNGVPKLRATLYAGVLGFSTVGLFYGAAPETYSASAFGLTAAAYLACRRDIGEPWWHVAALYAWSALTTNIVILGIWALVRHWQSQPVVAWLRRVAVSIAISAALVVAVALVQKAIYPGTVLFFASHSVAKESHWLYPERLQKPVETSRVLLQHQWISNIIAPEPERQTPFFPDQPMASIESGTWDKFAPSWPIFALWSLVLLGALPALGDKRFYSPAILGALAVLGFNFCFFFIFGHDRMLYAALWTSISVFLVSMGWESLIRRVPAMSVAAAVLLIVLLPWQAIHNWHFMDKIAALVK